MRNLKLKEELMARMEELPEAGQRQVLEFARSLSPVTRGVPGRDLLRFAGVLDEQSAKEMSEAIEADHPGIDRRD